MYVNYYETRQKQLSSSFYETNDKVYVKDSCVLSRLTSVHEIICHFTDVDKRNKMPGVVVIVSPCCITTHY